jgi:hypothetical protein
MKHNADLEKYINERIQKDNCKNPSMAQLNAYIADYMHILNNRPRADFEGYSSAEMHLILDLPFEKDSPFQLIQLPQGEYEHIPILRQVKRVLQIMDEGKVLKLTATGSLPVWIVKELHLLGAGGRGIDIIEPKIIREADCESAQLARGLCEVSGLVKKQKGILTVTKKGKTIMADDGQLFRLLFEIFCTKFNWAYFDLYEMQQVGRLGFGFSLIMMAKYGETEQTDSFYAQKYFTAFPMLKVGVIPTYSTIDKYCENCYSLRTFDRFMKHFGLVEIQKEKGVGTDTFIKKTPLFDKLIKIEPHRDRMPVPN